MNSTHLKITAIVLAAFLIIIADLAFLGLFEDSTLKHGVMISEPYFVVEKNPANYLSGGDVLYIEYNGSDDKWLFRDADKWNVIRTDILSGYLLSEKMKPFMPIKDFDYSEIDRGNDTKIPELNHSLNFSANDGVLRYNLYYRNAMNVECIEALSNITYALSRQTLSDNFTGAEADNLSAELISVTEKSVKISNLPYHESICIEDTYNLPTPKINEIYYLMIYYKEIDSVDVPGRTIVSHDYEYKINGSGLIYPAVFVIKDSRTEFESPYFYGFNTEHKFDEIPAATT